MERCWLAVAPFDLVKVSFLSPSAHVVPQDNGSVRCNESAMDITAILVSC
jgi:hypothetical protein